MRLIGYWFRHLGDADFIPPQELVGPLPDDARRAVADYLDRGRMHERYRGTSWCRFYCDREMGSSELSDGRWAWPVDLGHYVRDHGVLLPDEFIERALADDPYPAPPPNSGEPLDLDYWKEWCRAHRSGRYRLRLDEANARADAEARRLLDADAATLEAGHGLSPDRCQWINCARRALAGRALCARCQVRTDGRNLRCAAHYDFAHVFE